jgi:Tol biopolymer transport system component
LVWGRTEEQGDHYYLINVDDGAWTIVGESVLDKYGDGHPSYSPDRRWIVTDTYPDKARQRHLLLFNTETEELIELGRFFAPWAFDGPERCDLHPRWSPDGRHISIDSAHEGVRKSYILDVDEIVQ